MDLSITQRLAVPLVVSAAVTALVGVSLATTLIASAHRDAMDRARGFLGGEASRQAGDLLALGLEIDALANADTGLDRLAAAAEDLGFLHLTDPDGQILLSTDPLAVGRSADTSRTLETPLVTDFGTVVGSVIVEPNDDATDAVRDAALGRAVTASLVAAVFAGLLCWVGCRQASRSLRHNLSGRAQAADAFALAPRDMASDDELIAAAAAAWQDLQHLEAEILRLDPQD